MSQRYNNGYHKEPSIIGRRKATPLLGVTRSFASPIYAEPIERSQKYDPATSGYDRNESEAWEKPKYLGPVDRDKANADAIKASVARTKAKYDKEYPEMWDTLKKGGKNKKAKS